MPLPTFNQKFKNLSPLSLLDSLPHKENKASPFFFRVCSLFLNFLFFFFYHPPANYFSLSFPPIEKLKLRPTLILLFSSLPFYPRKSPTLFTFHPPAFIAKRETPYLKTLAVCDVSENLPSAGAVVDHHRRWR